MIDVYEPVEEGLDKVESRRYVSCLTIFLSISLLDDPHFNTDHLGYQPPLPNADIQSKEMHVKRQQQQTAWSALETYIHMILFIVHT